MSKPYIMKIEVEDIIREACPVGKLAVIRADVVNTESDQSLWAEISQMEKKIQSSYEISWISKRPAISATRQLYKSLGKDPNRYRVSSEALCRRIVKGMELYHINTLVDLINLVSIGSGYSIGGFDADKIEGDCLKLGVGRKNERFEGIGRGLLNIEGLPVYRDRIGGIGSPTSDEERTKLTIETRKIQVIINAYAEEMPLTDTVYWLASLLEKYASGENVEVEYYQL